MCSEVESMDSNFLNCSASQINKCEQNVQHALMEFKNIECEIENERNSIDSDTKNFSLMLQEYKNTISNTKSK